MEVLRYNLPNHLSYKSMLEDVLHQNKELSKETGTKEPQNRGHNVGRGRGLQDDSCAPIPENIQS